MYKVWVIARREYLALVSTKSFWIGLVLPPALALLTLLLAALSTGAEEVETRRIVLVDPGGWLSGFERSAQARGRSRPFTSSIVTGREGFSVGFSMNLK